MGSTMNHKLLAARAPLAWITLGLVLATVLVQVLVANTYGTFGFGPVEVAGTLIVNPFALLLLVLVTLSCHASPRPERVKALTITVAVVVSLLMVASIVQTIADFQIMSQPVRWWEALAAGPLYAIVPLVVLTALVWVMVASLKPSSAGDPAQATDEDASSFTDPGPQSVSSDGPEEPSTELAPPEVPSSADQAPTWQLDKASGVVWQSAAAAASGAQGSGYGMPGQARGTWQPAPALESSEAGEPGAATALSPTTGASPVSPASPVSADFADEDDSVAEDSATQAGRRFASAAGLEEGAASSEPSSPDYPSQN